MEEQENNKADLGGLSVKDIFFKYIRFLPIFILSVALALLVAWAYLRWSTPIYSAQGSILIKSENNRSGGNDKFEDLFMGNGSANIPNEMEVLKSRPLMERVVKELGLQLSYFAVGKIRTPNIYKDGPFTLEIFELNDSSKAFTLNISFSDNNTFSVNNESRHFSFGELFSNAHGIFRLQKNEGQPGNEYIVSWQPAVVVASELVNNLVVVPKTPGTGILLLSIQTTNPAMSADVINKLMQQYQLASVEEKNLTTRQIIDFIDDRMVKLQHELDSIEMSMLAYRQTNNIIDQEYQSGNYFEKLSESDKQINEQRIQVNISEIVEDYLADKRNEFERVPSSLGLQDPTLNGLIGAYNQAQLEHKALIDGNAPPGNVVVKQKEQQIEQLRKSLLENLRNLRSSYNSSIADLQKTSNSVESEIRLLPAKTRELLEIERQQQSKLALYKILMEKREETAISQASTISNSNIVDIAHPNITPVKPNPRSVQLMALLIGLALPALFIFILELLNDKVNTRNDIEKNTSAPILGEIGHDRSRQTLAVTKTNRSMVAEQFRSIRSNLQYFLNKVEKPVIMVTSSFSGEGKSFISTNIGAVMALAGKRTVVLEFDIRKPKLFSGLGLPKKVGITNFLVGDTTLEELPVQVPGYNNFFVIACGPVPPNPSELLLDEKISDLFAWLKQHYDVIVIDTAPIGMVSDAMTLGKYSDATLYIVRQEYTFKKQIGLIDELYQEKRLPKISIVLNDVKLKPGYGYYGYGRYGYGKGYGNGYYMEEESSGNGLFGWLPFRKNKKKVKA
jgi:capsular exopolysaccharide family